MNLFVLDKNPELSAQYHCDKHVVKMVLEGAQCMCSAAHIAINNKILTIEGKDRAINLLLDFKNSIPYKLTHGNHPVPLWASESYINFSYLQIHTYQLLREYARRYKKRHKCTDVLLFFKRNCYILFDMFPGHAFSLPPLCMPDEYRIEPCNTIDDVVHSYRQYYTNEKHDIAQWRYTEKPNWYVEPSNSI